MIYAAGPFSSGTRLLFDLIRGLGLEAVHAPLPGHRDRPDGELDKGNPVWWTKSEMEELFGAGRWVIITRDAEFAAQSAVARGFLATTDEYAPAREQALEVFDAIEDAHRLTYEDLLADPQGEYDKLADWLGVARKTVPQLRDGNAKYQTEKARPKSRRRRGYYPS